MNTGDLQNQNEGVLPKPGFLSKIGLDTFVILLLAMIVLARLFPGPGVYEGTFSLANIASWGVSFIFFFYGLRLSPEKLKAGLSKWKLHLLVQLTIFVLFPVLVFAAMQIFKNESNQYLWLGVFFLAALPSTVSSSVVMVSIARGNMPAAIFNASISSLLGVFITPTLMGLVLDSAPGQFDLTAIIIKLALQVLAPVVLGILLHKKWGDFAERNKKLLKNFDQSIILLIVYTSFCESFERDMFRDFSIQDLLLLTACMAVLFFVVFFIVKAFCRLLRFDREDTITALFCSSKKSLVHGTVMSKVLFAGSEVTGIILLPVMLYHALQLIIASIMAQRYAAQKDRGSA
ncbi:bile acid:sodium symporter [Segetibacter sp. 3557_3]|uniref:bile acid:sodium symporter family protein n=1 Tax=Segetibacter sp. 3557_3 TaxID=2547429 RepID=UPI001058A8AF|nr:bile acid:sodium symporter family protein [Segetibacter sp. 3557_3]TDH26966.1 bile acid:sodium symporter [Segetibacter sp. 3557_3]